MADTSTLLHIWNLLVESNTFNFVIFVICFALIFKKINVAGIIASLQEKIVKVLNEVEKDKNEALEKLTAAEKEIENLSSELDTILNEAKNSAEVIGKKILSEAEKQVQNIEQNAKKVIEAEEKMLVSSLTKETSKASVAAAKNHIQNVLVQTPTLHEKYIDECIEELDKVNF